MDSKTITYDQMVGFLRSAVAAEGKDYVDPLAKERIACKYSYSVKKYGGCGSCIIGWVLKNCLNESIDGDVQRFGAAQAFKYYGYELDQRTRYLVTAAQSMQDGGMTWYKAIEAAVKQT